MAYQEIYQPLHTVIGSGSLAEIPGLAKRIDCKKALVVTDEGLKKIGTLKMVTDVLDKEGVPYETYAEVRPNPTCAMVRAAYKKFTEGGCDYLIALGGGSAMDCSKAVSIMATNGGDVKDYEGVNKSKVKGAPMIAINTTAGTGSEVTLFYIITDEERKVKMAMVDPHCLAYAAVDDPEVMAGMPPSLTAATGMDALTHAIEAYTANGHYPFCDGLAIEAIKLIARFLERAVVNGRDMIARENMCWAQYMAGVAFSNAGLGMVHAMAHQLGGFYNMPHGQCNAMLLPHVMEYNKSINKKRYADVGKALGIPTDAMTIDQAADATIKWIVDISKRINIPALKDSKFDPKDVPTLAANAMHDACMAANAIQPAVEDVEATFMAAYNAE
ncbi:MAG: iron-containing alcohol dehydrogenase [Eubacteriales bacterium]|nr:iron-containing alcohol dehydrogenase [Eubacteriales bacterium]